MIITAEIKCFISVFGKDKPPPVLPLRQAQWPGQAQRGGYPLRQAQGGIKGE